MATITSSPSSKMNSLRLDREDKSTSRAFRFFDLPSEIRNKVYALVLFTETARQKKRSRKEDPIDNPRFSVFLASQRFHKEASYFFYSTQIFRIFPVYDFSRLPPVSGVGPRYRQHLHTIELVLGSGWTKPPKSWTVNNGLGLSEMAGARTLKVFVQCDPSDPAFKDFRISEFYYTCFAGELLRQVLKALPSLVQVEFDGYPWVKLKGSLVMRLLEEADKAGKKILFGPERGWTYEDVAQAVPAAFNPKKCTLVSKKSKKSKSSAAQDVAPALA